LLHTAEAPAEQEKEQPAAAAEHENEQPAAEPAAEKEEDKAEEKQTEKSPERVKERERSRERSRYGCVKAAAVSQQHLRGSLPVRLLSRRVVNRALKVYYTYLHVC
jgi:hypothetical protein